LVTLQRDQTHRLRGNGVVGSLHAVGAPLRVLVLADTHVGRTATRDLPATVWAMVDDADVVLHAGDIKTDAFLDRLSSAATTYAVAGNNDVDMSDPPPVEQRLELAGVAVAMVHDAGPSLGRARRMRRRFPDADLVVFGHSHIPLDVVGDGGQRLFNPGSPTVRRRQPRHTVGRLVLDAGEILEHQIMGLD
jgi:putative phosphoesterase